VLRAQPLITRVTTLLATQKDADADFVALVERLVIASIKNMSEREFKLLMA
jgi:hypothetical protein